MILIGVLLLSTIWYFLGGRQHYYGPRNFTGGAAADQGLSHSIDRVKNDGLPTHDTASEEKQPI